MAQKTIIRDAKVRWIGLIAALLILLSGVVLQTLAGYSAEDNSGHAWGSDDAWISYRYARNLAHGEGLVFNAGERVEGYSNFLYVLLIAAGFSFTDGFGIYVYSVVLNSLFMAAALIVFHSYMRERFGDWIALVSAMLFAMLPAVWVWTASGLETPLALLLQLSIWVNVERIAASDDTQRQRILLALLVLLSVLTRADGFITPIIAAVYLALKGKRQAALVVAAAAAITLTAHILFRLAYYGYPLPNTYYVKVSGTLFARLKSAIKQLIAYMPRYGLQPYLLILAAAFLSTAIQAVQDWRTTLQQMRFDVFLAAGWLGYFLYTGGDTFDERFLLILSCLGVTILFEMGQRIRPLRELALIAVPICLAYYGAALILDTRYDFRTEKYDRWLMLGEFLREEHPEALLAIDGAGKAPYFSGLETVDMLGLNDAFIAHQTVSGFGNPGHNKHDVDYVFSREPDVIAAWLLPYSLDMSWDLTQERYEAEGYELRYLVNSSAVSRGDENILDARLLSDEEIKVLTVDGYEYGVLIRTK